MELLLPEDLADFNRSRFARHTGFSVKPLGHGYGEWAYEDSAGVHVMASPPLSDALEIVAPAFRSTEVHHDGMFMTHVVATDRRG